MIPILVCVLLEQALKRNSMFSDLLFCLGELIHGEVSDFLRISEQLSGTDSQS